MPYERASHEVHGRFDAIVLQDSAHDIVTWWKPKKNGNSHNGVRNGIAGLLQHVGQFHGPVHIGLDVLHIKFSKFVKLLLKVDGLLNRLLSIKVLKLCPHLM